MYVQSRSRLISSITEYDLCNYGYLCFAPVSLNTPTLRLYSYQTINTWLKTVQTWPVRYRPIISDQRHNVVHIESSVFI